MMFSDSAGKTGLYEDALDMTQTDTNAFPVAKFARMANRWYYKAVIAIWKAQDSWIFDDGSQTGNGVPAAAQTLTNGTSTYTLPTTALKILRVEVKDAAGNWSVVTPISLEEIGSAVPEFYETAGMPRKYLLSQNDLQLFPAPDNGVSVTLTNGLNIYFLREVDEFTSSDTTQEPGIPEPFHRILSLGASFDFCLSHGKTNANAIRSEVGQLMQEMAEFFSSRNKDKSRLQITRSRTQPL